MKITVELTEEEIETIMDIWSPWPGVDQPQAPVFDVRKNVFAVRKKIYDAITLNRSEESK
jgi:hypothetical protein